MGILKIVKKKDLNNVNKCLFNCFKRDKKKYFTLFFNYFRNKHSGIKDQLLIDIKDKTIKKHHINKLDEL